MFASSFFDQPHWGYSSDPFARRSLFGQQQPRRQRQQRQYHSEDEMLEIQRQEQQQRQQQVQRLQLERERQAAVAHQQRKEAMLQRQEQIKQRTLFLIRAKIASRTIQRAWRAYCEGRDGAMHAKREAAAFVITRAIRNFPAIIQAKRIVKSLEELKIIAEQVEAVDPATAFKIGAGITGFENTMDKLVAKIDLVDSWGSPLVRSQRKQIVLRANERIHNVLHPEELKRKAISTEESSKSTTKQRKGNNKNTIRILRRSPRTTTC